MRGARRLLHPPPHRLPRAAHVPFQVALGLQPTIAGHGADRSLHRPLDLLTEAFHLLLDTTHVSLLVTENAVVKVQEHRACQAGRPFWLVAGGFLLLFVASLVRAL